MSVNYDYLFQLKSHYKNNKFENKENMIKELQVNMQDELENNFIDEYVVKKDMPYFQNNAILNFKDNLSVVLKAKRYKEVVYDSLAKTIQLEKNIVDVGDYITINEDGIDKIYLTMSKPIKKTTHDEIFMLNCQNEVKILDDDGKTVYSYSSVYLQTIWDYILLVMGTKSIRG